MSFQLSLNTESVLAAYPDDPLIVQPDATVAEVLQLMCAQKTGSVLICTDGKLQGIFTERDALRWMAAVAAGQVDASGNVPISDLMATSLTSLLADTTVGEAIQLMSSKRYRHLPIVDSTGKPSAMATVYGIVHYLVDHFPNTIYTLPPKAGTAPAEREGA